jgi:hypothetical protein
VLSSQTSVQPSTPREPSPARATQIQHRECFDLVFCFGILHRVENPLGLLRGRTVRGGTVLLETYGVGPERPQRPRDPRLRARRVETMACTGPGAMA